MPPFRVPLPTALPPLTKKLIEPVGVPVPLVGAALAVKTTGPLDPTFTAVSESVKVVVVEAVVCTVNCSVEDVEPAKFASPLYCAVIV